MIPKLLELDDHGALKYITQRTRAHAADPSAGFGHTASQGLRDDAGNQFFSHNQEATIGKTQALPPGAEMATIDNEGQRQVVATWDGTQAAQDKLTPPPAP